MTEEWSQKNPDFKTLCANYSPAYWSSVARLGHEVYNRENPALAALSSLYGNEDAPSAWIHLHILAYTTSINERDKSILASIPLFARSFAQEVRRYHLLEIMLFFSRLIAGRYKVYGRFEPRQIGEAWQLFLKEREAEMDEELARRKLREREALHKPNPNYLTRDEYLELKIWENAGYSISDMRQFRNRIRSWVQRARNGFYATTI